MTSKNGSLWELSNNYIKCIFGIKAINFKSEFEQPIILQQTSVGTQIFWNKTNNGIQAQYRKCDVTYSTLFIPYAKCIACNIKGNLKEQQNDSNNRKRRLEINSFEYSDDSTQNPTKKRKIIVSNSQSDQQLD